MFKKEIEILTALANGVNYFTGEKCENDSVLNDSSLIRALFNMCEKLKQITPGKIKKTDFKFDPEVLEKFEYVEGYISLTDIINKLSNLNPTMKKLKYAQIYDVLNRKGLLVKEPNTEGRLRAVATVEGEKYGIKNVKKLSFYGKEYTSVSYDKNGQRYVLSILNEIE